MSTKNLARTVIEGGRTGRSKWKRRRSNRVHRVREHAVLKRLRDDLEHDDVVFRPRKHVNRRFNDKLGAMGRWLADQVGRPWTGVHREVFERFDTRTTAGRHIVHDHLLRAIGVPVWRFGFLWTPDYVIDRHGILRQFNERKRKP